VSGPQVVTMGGMVLRYRRAGQVAEVCAEPGATRRPYLVRVTGEDGRVSVSAAGITAAGLPLHLSRLRADGWQWAGQQAAP
jgi:hypothetical protein